MKRSLMLLMALVLVASATIGYQPTPTRAAAPTLSDFFPEKTFLYGEMDTSNLPATLDNFVALANQLGGNIPKDWRTLATTELNKMLGPDSKVDFDKDLLGWVGDRAAFGVSIPESGFSFVGRGDAPKPNAQPQTSIVIAVKDEAKADTFLKDIVLKSMPAVTPETQSVNGETVTLYKLQPDSMLARWKGYIAIGQVQLTLDTLKDKKPTLTGSANYKKLVATLKAGTLMSVYVRTPFAANSATFGFFTLGLLGPSIGNVFTNIVDGLNGTPTPTPSPTPPPNPDEQRIVDTVLALGGSIYSVRSEGKALIMDVTSAYDMDAVKTLGNILGIDLSPIVNAPNPVTGNLVDAIPANATAVIIGSDIPQIYNSTLVEVVAMQKAFTILQRQPTQTGDSLKMVSGQVEGALKMVTGLDLQKDVLAWTGDYALYVTDDKGGALDKMTEGAFPFAENFIVASSDKAKSAALAEALVRLVNSRGSKESAVTSPDANGLFTVALSPGLDAKIGTFGGNFVVSTDAKFTIKPTSALSTSPAWQNAVKFAPKGYSQLMYVDAGKLTALVDTLEKLSAGNPSSQGQITQLRALLKPFESALIVYVPQGTGLSTTSFVLIQK